MVVNDKVIEDLVATIDRLNEFKTVLTCLYGNGSRFDEQFFHTFVHYSEKPDPTWEDVADLRHIASELNKLADQMEMDILS